MDLDQATNGEKEVFEIYNRNLYFLPTLDMPIKFTGLANKLLLNFYGFSLGMYMKDNTVPQLSNGSLSFKAMYELK